MQPTKVSLKESAREKVCNHCRSRGTAGKEGPAGTEYASVWFCQACWDSWDSKYCSRCGVHDGDATKGRDGNWVCRMCTKAGRAEPSPSAQTQIRQSQPKQKRLEKCARPDCQYLEHSTVDIAYCCRCCMQGDNPDEPHGHACERRLIVSGNAGSSQMGQMMTKDLECMSVGDLRRHCKELGMDLSGCVEKEDIVSRLRAMVGPGKSRAEQAQPMVATEAITTVNTSGACARPKAGRPAHSFEASDKMSVRELLQLCHSCGIDVSGCVEKPDIISRFHAGLNSKASQDSGGVGQEQETLSHEDMPLIDSASSCPDEESAFDSEDVEEIDMEAAWRATAKAAPAKPAPAAATEPSSTRIDADPQRHLRSLKAGIEECNSELVAEALVKLGSNAEAIVCSTDNRGRSLLHVCAENVGHSSMKNIFSLLIEHSAQVNLRDSAGQVPLAVAVAAGLISTTEEQAATREAIHALLHAGASINLTEEWHSDTSALALVVDAGSGNAYIAELLLDFGADLPWHPLSLQKGTRTGDVQMVCRALEKLGDNAQAVVCAIDSDGNSLLHVCGENAARTTTKNIIMLLVQHMADVDVRNSDGLVPLEVAVDIGLLTIDSEASASAARDTVLALLLAGASVNIAHEWHSENSALARAVFGGQPSGTAIAELLLDFGADIQWHPLSLHAAVKSGNLKGAKSALEKLGDHADVSLKSTDSRGRTVLHMCALNAAAPGSGDVCRHLLRCTANADVQDLSGNVPVALAVAATLEITPGHSSGAALDTIRALLAHPPRRQSDMGSDQAMEFAQAAWCSANSPLAKALPHSPAREVLELLDEFGVRPPWYSRMQEAQARCADHDIPLDLLGVDAASNVLRECDRMQGMSFQALQMECKCRKLPADHCIEKTDILRLLRQVRIDEEIGALHAPSLKFVGTWCYGRKPNEYTVFVGADAQELRFDAPHPQHGRLVGLLKPECDGQLLAHLTAKENVSSNAGLVRLRYSDTDRTMVSNFKGATMSDWSRDIIARKAVVLPEVGAGTSQQETPDLKAYEPELEPEVDAAATV